VKYTPILRNTQSEMLALKDLSAATKDTCVPLLNMAAPTKEKDKDEAQTAVARNLSRMSKVVSGFTRAYIESSELDPSFRVGGSVHPVLAGAKALATAGCIPVPVTGLHRDKSHHAAVKAVASTLGDDTLCVRLDATDITTPTMTANAINSLVNAIGISATKVTVLLDLQSTHDVPAEHLVVRLRKVIGTLSANSWGGFIVAGYGIPDRLPAVVKPRDQAYLPRVELQAFSKLATEIKIPNLWFGDYTTLSPNHVELDFRLIYKQMCPRAIYALADSWFVIRGAPFEAHGREQYREIAQDITALDEFSGTAFSFGDRYIDECGKGINAKGKPTTTGSPASWITACVNHHIVLTATL